MKRTTTESCILTLPLRPEKWQYDKLETDFRIGCQIYNCLRRETWNRYNQMIRTKRWKATLAQSESAEERKALFEQQKQLRKEYRLSEYAFHADVKKYQQHFSRNINSSVAQKLATSLWKAYEKLFFSNGNTVHFCRLDDFRSIEGKRNDSGIVFRNGVLMYGPHLSMRIQVGANPKDQYQMDMLSKPVKYCRILRKWVGTKWKYYLQLVLQGKPSCKVCPDTGIPKHPLGHSRVGIDIGVQTVAVVADNAVMLRELAPEVENISAQLRRIERAMDRSRRATNPDAFRSDGTYIKGKRIANRSNNYKQLAAKYRDLHRRQAAIRKQSHECLANEVLALGAEIYIEDMNFSGLQRRAQETIIKPNGKFATKRRFGKLLANKSPAEFVAILQRKLDAAHGKMTMVSTYATKASQYNHLTQLYSKKKLSMRMNIMPDGRKIQRDLYSAFLLQCTNNTYDGFDQTLCDSKYNNFVNLHDLEIARLRTNTHNLSSMGV